MMLCLSNVGKKFPGCDYPILKDISISFNEDDFCVIIGSNGSGKSTLLRTISGEYSIDYGTIRMKKRSVIASVVQDVNQGTIPQMSLLENVVLGSLRQRRAKLIPYAVHKKEAIARIKSLNMNLERFLYTPLQCLSGGQRQMIATLMAIQSEPNILLLDEHTSALDPKTQQKLMGYTQDAIKKKHILTLMVTHKLDDALKFGNRLIMLHEGKVVFDVANEEKEALSVSELLTFFHRYEDLSLTAGGAYE